MASNRYNKKIIIDEVAQYASKASSVVAVEYCGLSVAELTQLRVQAKSINVHLQVVKNTLSKRAVAGTQFECMQDGLKGPLLLAFSMESPGSAARLISNFAKTTDLLITKIIAFDGQLLDVSELARLASIPTRDEGIGLLMAVMKAPVGKLVCTLAAIRDKMQTAETVV